MRTKMTKTNTYLQQVLKTIMIFQTIRICIPYVGLGVALKLLRWIQELEVSAKKLYLYVLA